MRYMKLPTEEYVKARWIAFNAHDGQKRKYSGVPYIVHPLRVASQFDDYGIKACAILHDVIEDTHITLNELIPIFRKSIITTLNSLTKRSNEKYFDYIERLSQDSVAIEIKIADIIDNLSDGNIGESMIIRYNKGLNILINKIG